MTRLLLVVILVLAGCGSEPAPPPAPPVPPELTGTWTMITPNGNAFTYEFSAKGFYVYAGIMSDRSQQYTLQESGSAEATSSQVTLRPASVTVSRSDTSAPAGNYRSATTKPPRTVAWSVSGNELTIDSEVLERE